MVDRDPSSGSFVTARDAAIRRYRRGSTRGEAIVDAAPLPAKSSPPAPPRADHRLRSGAQSRHRQGRAHHRSHPPDAILREVWQRSGGRAPRTDRGRDAERRAEGISIATRRSAGFDRETLRSGRASSGRELARRRSRAAPATSAAQCASACGQRVRKRQPEGGSSGEGIAGFERATRRGRRDRAPGSPEQRRRVGMRRRGEQRARSRHLAELAEIHHRDAVATAFTTARSWAMKSSVRP